MGVVDEVTTDGSDPLAGFEGPRVLDNVTIGDDRFCEGIRRALAIMKFGEPAIVESSCPTLFLNEPLNISPGDATNIVVRMKLLKPKQDAPATREETAVEEAPPAKKPRAASPL